MAKNIGIIIQARMSSTRLPGKVLLPLNGMPVLSFIINRVKRSRYAKTIIIATSDRPENKQILSLAKKSRIKSYAGSEEDVLDRFYQAAKQFKLDIIVRITGDCPFSDPKIIDDVIKCLIENKSDYVNNVDPPTFPDGLDVEAFTFEALEKSHKEAVASHHREHVTAYIRESKKFNIRHIKSEHDYSPIRLTIDTKEDYEVVKDILKYLPKTSRNSKGSKDFSWLDIINVINNHPQLMKKNSKFIRDEKYLKQLREWRKNDKEQ